MLHGTVERRAAQERKQKNINQTMKAEAPQWEDHVNSVAERAAEKASDNRKEIVEAGGAALDKDTPEVEIREAAKELAWISAVESTNHWTPRKTLSFWADEAIMGTSLEIRQMIEQLIQIMTPSESQSTRRETGDKWMDSADGLMDFTEELIDPTTSEDALATARINTLKSITLVTARINTYEHTLPVLPLDPLYRRKTVEKVFPLLRVEVLQRMSWTVSSKDMRTIAVHSENWRKGKIEFRGMRQSNKKWRDNQLQLLGISDQKQYREVLKFRRTQIMESLSDGYLTVRTAILRVWIMVCVECEGTNPWRLHWPQDKGDDELMENFLTVLSLRYTTWAAVASGLTHVVEFHKAYLKVHPPPMPMAKFFLQKAKPALSKEKPAGRKVRPGLAHDEVSAILLSMHESILVSSGSTQLLYVNAGCAIALTYERAMRVSELCPGDRFHPAKHMSRQTVKAALKPLDELRHFEMLVLEPPERKCSHRSPVAQQKANQPMPIDCQGAEAYSAVMWFPLLEQYDACDIECRNTTPVFRIGGADNTALSAANVKILLQQVASSVVPRWHLFSYGLHSLRIGRESQWRATKLGRNNPELMNNLTGHTRTEGRLPYSRTALAEVLTIDRQAAKTRPQTVETAYKFSGNRAAAREDVYMIRKEDGTFATVTDKTATERLVDSDEEEEFYNQSVLNEEDSTVADVPAAKVQRKTVEQSSVKAQPTAIGGLCGCGCGEPITTQSRPKGRPAKNSVMCFAVGKYREITKSRPSPQKRPIPEWARAKPLPGSEPKGVPEAWVQRGRTQPARKVHRPHDETDSEVDEPSTEHIPTSDSDSDGELNYVKTVKLVPSTHRK